MYTPQELSTEDPQMTNMFPTLTEAWPGKDRPQSLSLTPVVKSHSWVKPHSPRTSVNYHKHNCPKPLIPSCEKQWAEVQILKPGLLQFKCKYYFEKFMRCEHWRLIKLDTISCWSLMWPMAKLSGQESWWRKDLTALRTSC